MFINTQSPISIGVKKSFKYQTLLVLLFVALFVFGRAKGSSGAGFYQNFVVSEIMYDPLGSNTAHSKWIELYNAGEDYEFSTTKSGEQFKLNDFYVCDSIASTGKCTKHYLYANAESVRFPKHSFLVVAQNPEQFNADYQSSGEPLKSALSISASDKAFVKFCWQSDETCSESVQYGSFAIAEKEGNSLEKIELGEGNQRNNWQRSFVAKGTPGKTNSQAEKIEPQIYAGEIRLNELLPNPNDGEEEFVELYNAGKTDEDIFGWTLHDASKTGEYKFLEHTIIKAKDYLVLLKKAFGFALNNSGSETLSLRDGAGNLVSQVAYNGSKKGVSYNFDGEAWHWSKFLTPGNFNILENVNAGELSIDKKVYINVYADFAIEGLPEGAKVTWDFGDGHKSYKAKTQHKYTRTGDYNGSVTFAQGSEDVVKDFTVSVEEIDHPKVRIMTISANPKGADTKSESIVIENKTKKKINLNGWSIATGWRKKFINHPIRLDLVLNSKKQKEITGVFSSFTLNNTKAEIELRYPDGEVAHRVKYKKSDGIKDDQKYVKVKGAGWQWKGEGQSGSHQSSVIESSADSKQEMVSQQSASPEEVEKVQEKKVEENKPTENVEIEILKTKGPANIQLLSDPRVLGAEKIRAENGQYYFMPQLQAEPHYAVVFLNGITSNLNRELNILINYFVN